MSRIGAKAIALPPGVTVSVSGATVTVKGTKGELSLTLLPNITVALEGTDVKVARKGDTREERARHGLTRALLACMVQGVSKGFEKRLEIIGVGFKAQAKGKSVTLQLGFSHPVDYKSLDGVEIAQDTENKQILVIKGIDKQKVGQVAADIRSFRPPEPYKGKGIRYVDEYVRRKVGKAAVKAAA